MAPSSGYHMVPKGMRILKYAFAKANAIIRSKLPTSTTSATANATLQPIRISSQIQPIHPLARLRQSRAQHRWSSTSTREFTSASRNAGQKYVRSSFPVSKTSRAVARSGAAPFASTLRPNLTGGALPRSAGGYCLGGSGRGVRHFSHTPGSQAQVVQNVSAGLRAFCVGGGKARYDGVDPLTGEKRYKTITQLEDKVLTSFTKFAPSTTLEFCLSPTITALSTCFPSSPGSPFFTSTTEKTTLNTLGLLDTLATDFARALKDLSVVLSDLRRIATLGDLPLSLSTSTGDRGPTLSVRFPGCDAQIVSSLCDELGVRYGIVREDEDWNGNKAVEMALLFPFAPASEGSNIEDGGEYFFDQDDHIIPAVTTRPEQVDWRNMLSPHPTKPSSFSPSSASSITSFEEVHRTPLRSPSGYESLRDSDFAEEDPYFRPGFVASGAVAAVDTEVGESGGEYEGVEGIWRFLRECEGARL